MENYLIRGILIGLLFGMPVGVVGAMAVQRTISHGLKAGLITGLGSSAADCLYACVGAFGLTLISDFLLEHQAKINVLGGVLILTMGIRLIVRREEAGEPLKQVQGKIKMFLSSFAVGITNPAAILTFLVAFSYFGIAGRTGWFRGIQLAAGVFIGTYLWWIVLSTAVNRMKKKAGEHGFRHRNKIFGTVLLLFGMAVFMRAFL